MSQKKNKAKKESFFNLHFTSTISISLVLYMVGVIIALYQSTSYYAKESKENISMSVILQDSIQQKETDRLKKYLTAVPYIHKIEYISKDSALTEHINALGDDPSQLIGYNPLNASIEVYLKAEYANVDSIKKVIIPKISHFDGIEEIVYQEDMLEMLSKNIKRLSILFSFIALVLLFISIVLINNTIRISIYSKRFIINTMQLVGARNGFIRKPFIKRSFINSLIASIISILLLSGTVYFIQNQLSSNINIIQFEIWIPVVVAIFIISFIINYIATVAAVNRYLRMSTNDLYFI